MKRSYPNSDGYFSTYMPRETIETQAYYPKKDLEDYCDFFDLGDKAPDFTLPAIVKGEESSVTLSSFRGKWVVLFFYSSDFTFL